MALLRPTPVSTDRFTWVPVENMFVAEASDLNDVELSHVYDDAADHGFTLVGAKSGREVVYAEHHEERDGDGDLLWIDFVPALYQRTTCTAKVRLFND